MVLVGALYTSKLCISCNILSSVALYIMLNDAQTKTTDRFLAIVIYWFHWVSRKVRSSSPDPNVARNILDARVYVSPY